MLQKFLKCKVYQQKLLLQGLCGSICLNACLNLISYESIPTNRAFSDDYTTKSSVSKNSNRLTLDITSWNRHSLLSVVAGWWYFGCNFTWHRVSCRICRNWTDETDFSITLRSKWIYLRFVCTICSYVTKLMTVIALSFWFWNKGRLLLIFFLTFGISVIILIMLIFLWC